jgi:hypothetical protein
MKPIKTIVGERFVGRIYVDESPSYPFNDFEFLGKLYIPSNTPLQSTCNEVYFNDSCVKVPIYAMSHGGITINTTGFSCPWDSAQIGWICASRADILNWFMRTVLSKKLKDCVHDHLVSEIQTINQWLNGEIYGYSIVKKEDASLKDTFEDSCWGFYGLDWCTECLEAEIKQYEGKING